MTDINNWPELIKFETTSDDAKYISIPVNGYLLANLLGCLKRSRDLANGDWFDEWITIVSVAMRTLNIEVLTNNFGDTFHNGLVWKEMYPDLAKGETHENQEGSN